jgi:hypothetical protein
LLLLASSIAGVDEVSWQHEMHEKDLIVREVVSSAPGV